MRKLILTFKSRQNQVSTGALEKDRLGAIIDVLSKHKLTPSEAKEATADPASLLDSADRCNADFIVHVSDNFVDCFYSANRHRNVLEESRLHASTPQELARSIKEDIDVQSKFAALFPPDFHRGSINREDIIVAHATL